MQSRMDKYNKVESGSFKSRSQKNKDLYESVRNSTLMEFDVNSNMSVIDNNAKSIDVFEIRKILDKKYNEDMPKRRSITLPEYENEIEEPTIEDTKEYDINAILNKAKQGKNIDYTKERLKRVRDAQYEILNNLDLELKHDEELTKAKKKEAEDTLINLINTITSIEQENKKKISKEASQALDLLTDLRDDPEEEVKQELPKENEEKVEEIIEKKEEVKSKKKADEKDHIDKTLSKLNIDLSSYDDFADISKRDNGSIILKIIIFLLVIALVFGAVYILDNILGLGLFK